MDGSHTGQRARQYQQREENRTGDSKPSGFGFRLFHGLARGVHYFFGAASISSFQNSF